MSRQQERAKYKRLVLLSGYKPRAKPGQSLGAPGRTDNTTHVGFTRPDIGAGTARMSRGIR